MEYTFKTLEFEGPLDLLLHLVKEANIDIFEIKISDITDQYLAYISKMNELDLNIDSEYLVMAADLIEMKSKELLPHEEDDEEEEDPKEVLINRLIEYQKYKEITADLKELEENRSELYSKLPSILDEYKDETLKVNDDLSLDDLIKAFMNLKEKQILEKPLNTVITKKEYSVDVRSKDILNRLKKSKQIKFVDLFDVYAKDYVVVTFLSILDLAKKGNITIKQDRNLDEITLLAREV
ncbi:MAG: segregation/condensation protein A [Bacilli bacterium]|nr:segregation/condensation protein A [Bacilli bacterium]